MTKALFLEEHSKVATKTSKNAIIKSTVTFFNELEVLVYDFCKLALVDGFLKRYLKSYVAAAIVLLSFDTMMTKVLDVNQKTAKFDNTHLVRAYQCLNKVITNYFGFNKFVFF